MLTTMLRSLRSRLRRTGAGVEAGQHAEVVTEFVGPRGITVTVEVYAHVLAPAPERAASALDRALRPYSRICDLAPAYLVGRSRPWRQPVAEYVAVRSFTKRSSSATGSLTQRPIRTGVSSPSQIR